MSRFAWMDGGDGDDDTNLAMGRWMGRRKKVLEGKPGKEALADLREALLAMPHKRLIEGELCDGSDVCVIGAWIYRRWVDSGTTPRKAWKALRSIGKGKEAGEYAYWDNGSYEEWSRTIDIGHQELGITRTLAEVASEVNDEGAGYGCTPEVRYDKVLAWVEKRLL